MFYAHFVDALGVEQEYISNSFETYYTATFSPACIELDLIEFCVKGKTYKEKKAFLHDLAVRWSHCAPSLTWSEAQAVANFFEINGKRYGLIDEFKENFIC